MARKTTNVPALSELLKLAAADADFLGGMLAEKGQPSPETYSDVALSLERAARAIKKQTKEAK